MGPSTSAGDVRTNFGFSAPLVFDLYECLWDRQSDGKELYSNHVSYVSKLSLKMRNKLLVTPAPRSKCFSFSATKPTGRLERQPQAENYKFMIIKADIALACKVLASSRVAEQRGSN